MALLLSASTATSSLVSFANLMRISIIINDIQQEKKDPQGVLCITGLQVEYTPQSLSSMVQIPFQKETFHISALYKDFIHTRHGYGCMERWMNLSWAETFGWMLVGTEVVLPFCKEKQKPHERFVSDQKLSTGENGIAALYYSDF